MTNRDSLTKFLDEFLAIHEIDDTCWNGLQVEGKKEVKTVGFAVDSGIETFQQAGRKHIDFLVVHHGQFWRVGNPSFVGWNRKRIDLLLENGISLYAAHLPLDRHRDIGNNAAIIQSIGATISEEFLLRNGKNVGWIGTWKKPALFTNVEEKIRSFINKDSHVLPFGKERVSRVAVCSGGGGYMGFFEAVGKNVDVYITGDPIEIYHTAKDAGMHVVFAGHHATEILGLKALSDAIKKTFAIQTQIIDIPTGL